VKFGPRIISNVGVGKTLCEKKRTYVVRKFRKILFCVEKRRKIFKLYSTCMLLVHIGNIHHSS
jgi:hypothetical protein